MKTRAVLPVLIRSLSLLDVLMTPLERPPSSPDSVQLVVQGLFVYPDVLDEVVLVEV